MTAPNGVATTRTASLRQRAALIALLALFTVSFASGCWYYPGKYQSDDHAHVKFENYTSDPVDVFINSAYRASISPFGSITFEVSAGSHELSATDNIGGDWGPIVVILDEGETFIYELQP
ncbi:MAG: hypothetical protein AB7K09_20670 [Planctomycetota bacterium]